MQKYTLTKRTPAPQRDMLAQNIACRCANALLPILREDVDAMSVAELRGYVRVHALPAVRVEVQQATAERRLSKTDSAELTSKAIERVIHRVIDELHKSPVIAMPTPHVRLRAAA